MRERLNKLIESERPNDYPSYEGLINQLDELCSTSVLSAYETKYNGHLIVQNIDDKMKEILVATELFNHPDDVKASEIEFKEFESKNAAIPNGYEVRLNYARGEKNHYYSSNSTSFSKPYRDKIPQIKEIFRELKTQHEFLKNELSKYYDNISQAVNESDSKHLENYIIAVADKYSNLPKEKCLQNARELAKDLYNRKGQEKDFLFTIKESCKWIFNKLTFGLTEKSANDKIDYLFLQADISQRMKEEREYARQIQQAISARRTHNLEINAKSEENPTKQELKSEKIEKAPETFGNKNFQTKIAKTNQGPVKAIIESFENRIKKQKELSNKKSNTK